MEQRLQLLEDENQALQAEISVLKKALASNNGESLSLRQQISRLEAKVSGVQPEMINKCIGTGDAFLPKPRILGGANKNGFNPFSTLHTATLLYAGAGSNNRYTVKATLAKGRRKRERSERTHRRPAPYYQDVSDSETMDEAIVLRRNGKPKMSLTGNETRLERARDSASSVSAPSLAAVVPEIRLGLATQEKPLVEISEEKIQTLKQRANTLEQTLHDALSSMENTNRATPRTENESRSSLSGASTPSRGRDRRQPVSGRNSAKQLQQERPRFWTEASFEVNGSPPPGNSYNQTNKDNSSNNNNYNNNNTKVSQDTTKTPRSGPLTVIKRPPDYCRVSGHFQERRAASETLPFTLEQEKSSLLSGRALPLASIKSLDKPVLQETPRQRVSPASVISSNGNNDKSKDSSNGANKSKQNGSSNHNKKDSQITAVNTNNNGNDKSHRSSFYNNTSSPNKQAHKISQTDKPSNKETDGHVSTDNKRVNPRLKAARAGGLVAKCLRCQKLFNSVDNHKLACCYHPKGKARFEHYDGSGRLVAVVHAWQCCQQGQDADGCCFGQHV
ncbi:hypothetical protein ElyMa_006525900 [Elysia marginata]|uniref:Uncharacterized protein n=1 Tax=Elysia marginata TaxID=1093978 RepID=A0AAV4I5D7_9GAST|nr:hypothetical protein ElyMa_006525900 [Elysia marginata]